MADPVPRLIVRVIGPSSEEVSIRALFEAIGVGGDIQRWRVEGIDAVGEQAEALHRMPVTEETSGSQLVTLSAGISQVIEGTFVGSLSDEVTPWCLVRAIDGIEFDVECRDPRVLAAIRATFPWAVDATGP